MAAKAKNVSESALQQFIARAIDQAPRARGFYDTLIQKRTGTSGKPLYDIQRGKTTKPGVDMLRVIADVLGQPLELLIQALDGRDVEPVTMPPAIEPDLPPTRLATEADDTVDIVALDLSLSMGPGTLIEEFVEEEPIKMGLRLVQSITRTPSNRLRLVRGIGDSMEPTLRTGDRVMVDINERALSRINGIYWIDHLGTHGIKRLRQAGRGKVLVISDNPTIDNFEVDADDLRIEGRVIWFGREL